MSETPTPYRLAPYFLATAAQKMEERAAQRDVAQERSMAKTVALFHTLYSFDLTEEHGWAFMLLLKLVRATTGSVDEDSMVDATAYCALMAEAQSVAAAQNTDLQPYSYDQMKAKLSDPEIPDSSRHYECQHCGWFISDRVFRIRSSEMCPRCGQVPVENFLIRR